MEELSSCGVFDCGKCKFRKEGTCPGCEHGNLFLEKWGRTPCAINLCVRAEGVKSCNDCGRPACALRGTTDNVCPLRAGVEDKRHWAWRIAQHLQGGDGPCASRHSVPLKTVMRFRWYLTALESFEEQGVDVISSRELADKIGMSSAIVRKDFSHIGELGTPGLGYRVSNLQEHIRNILGRNTCLVVWIGAQWLSNALSIFVPTMDLNFRIVAALDTRPEWIGKKIGEWDILPLSDLTALLSGGSVDGAVLALPEDARRVANILVEAGVKGILNLTPVTLATPPEVSVRHVDLLGEMMALVMECSGNGHNAVTSSRGHSRV